MGNRTGKGRKLGKDVVSGKACLSLISSGATRSAGLVLRRQGHRAFVPSVSPCPLQEMGKGQQEGKLECATMPRGSSEKVAGVSASAFCCRGDSSFLQKIIYLKLLGTFVQVVRVWIVIGQVGRATCTNT